MSTNKPEESSGAEKGKRKKPKPSGFEEWGGYMPAKKMKLNAQFEEQKEVLLDNENESQIFRGVAIFVNGYTKPPADQLKRLMLVHGGKYHHYYSTNKTTHVIASNLPHSKMKTLKTQTVVTADWITDSIKAGKLLSHHDYLLYTPEQVDKQQRLQFGNIHRAKSETLTYQEQVFELENKEQPEPTTSISDASTLKTTNQLEKDLTQPQTSTIDTTHTNNVSQLETSISPHKSGAAITARHPDFLSEFYNNSRLHHISTAGQELKRYVQHLAEKNKERHFPSREKLRNLPQEELPFIGPLESFYNSNGKSNTKAENVIMHLDMDCFFVSVGLKKHPELKGLPVAVTHAKGKRGGPQDGSDIHYEAAHYANESKKKIGGVVAGQRSETPDVSKEKPKISINSKEYGSLSEIASCSYEARKAGLRNGMFLGEALRRCPNLKTIPYDFEGYSEVSKQLYNIVAGHTLDIEAVSCDELYIDCKELLQDTQVSPNQFASILRSEIEEKTGCTASAGIGSNMLLARLANKVAKPNGQHYIYNYEIDNFMKEQKVRDLPGVGYSTSKKLEQLGVITCGDLQTWPLEKLQKEFGPKTGQSLFNRCRGNDNRAVQPQKDRKSVSAEINYGIRFAMEDDIYKFINDLSVEVHNRLQSIGSKGKSLTLKLMVRKSDAPLTTAKFLGHGVCDHLSKSITLKSATDSSKIIADECCTIARSLKIKPQDYRGVGIQMSKLELVQKEEKVPKIMKSFLCQNKIESISKSKTEKDTVLPNSRIADKPPPDNTIKHFLSNKPVSQKKQYNLSDYLYGEPSQSFLDALPEDLREEVLKTCQHTPSAVGDNNPGPSCSDAPTPVAPSDLNKNRTEEANQNNLDQSVLNALPEELRKEVLESYRAPVINTGEPSSHALPKATSLMENDETPKSNKGSYVIADEDSNEINLVESANPEMEEPSVVQVKKKETANLGGAFEIDDIRSLLREWVHSSEVYFYIDLHGPKLIAQCNEFNIALSGVSIGFQSKPILQKLINFSEQDMKPPKPLEDDVNDLNNFLMEAIEENSFYKTEMVLKYLYRLAKSTTDKWKNAYLTVLSNVQGIMKELQMGVLEAYEDFPS